MAKKSLQDINPLEYDLSTNVSVSPKQQTDRLIQLGKGVYKDKISGKLLYNYDEMPTAEVVGHKKEKSINDNWQKAYAKGIPSGTMASDMETMNAVTGGALNLISPSQVVGAAIHSDKPQDYFLNLLKGNNGIVTDNFSKKHPYWSIAANGLFDGISFGTTSILKNPQKLSSIAVRDLKNLPNSENLMYHLDFGNNVGAFSKNGAFIKDGLLYPGAAKDINQKSFIWFNKGKPYTTSIRGKKLNRAIIANEDDINGLLKVRDSTEPIGQWNGSSGFVLPSEYVTDIPFNISKGLIYNRKQLPLIGEFWLRTGIGKQVLKNSANYIKQGSKNIKPFIKDISVNYKDYLNDINHLPQTIKAIKDGRYIPFMTRQQAKIALRKNQEALQKVFDDAYNFNKEIEANKSSPINIDEQYKVNIDNWDKVWKSSDNIPDLNNSPLINSKPTLHIKPLKYKENQSFQKYAGYYMGSDNSVYIPSRDRNLMLKHILIDPNSNSVKSLLAHELKHHIQKVVPEYRDIARYNFWTGEDFTNPNNAIANEVFAPIKPNASHYITAWNGSPYEVQAELAGLQYKFNNPNNYINQPWYNKLRMKNFIADRFYITPSEANKMLKGMSRNSLAMGGHINN